jgi:saccharopine dehydrogenase-like NADP-dependent oxidoreductase
MARVLVVGGYGTFGSRAIRHLANLGLASVIVAGRDLAKAEETAAVFARTLGLDTTAAAIDAEAPDAGQIAALAPDIILNASGPFQAQGYALARAAIAARAHYVDLADARGFVEAIGSLDQDARAAGVLVASGASSVPALSCAVVDAYKSRLSRIECIEIGICPANGFDPGLATTRAVLAGIGRPMPALRAGQWRSVYGWQDTHRHTFPGIGGRWMANCDVPDLTLLPARLPEARTVRFSAGVEVGMMHFGLWAISWLVRVGVLRRAERFAEPLLKTKRLLAGLGSDAGGMFVTLTGTGAHGAPQSIPWHVVARSNHGPFIPPAPAATLVAKLVRGEVTARGAMPCVGLVSLAEIAEPLKAFDVQFTLSDTSQR